MLQPGLKLLHLGADRTAFSSSTTTRLLTEGAAHEPDGSNADGEEREDSLNFWGHGNQKPSAVPVWYIINDKTHAVPVM